MRIICNLLVSVPSVPLWFNLFWFAGLMPVASIRFIRSGKYDAAAAIGLTLAGIVGVLLAAFIVKELSLDAVRWLVVVVVLYTAVSMLWSARKCRDASL